MAKQLWLASTFASMHRSSNDVRLNGVASFWAARALSETQGTGALSVALLTVAGPTNGIEFMGCEEREALLGLLQRLERRWALPIPDATVWHAYNPLPFWMFLDGVRKAEQMTEGRRFLDLGCGIGSKLALMHALGWDVAGVEHHEPYAEAARELVPEATVWLGDIRDSPFAADLVYMYRPAREEELEAEIERSVLDRIEPGTVCFFPLRHEPEVWAA